MTSTKRRVGIVLFQLGGPDSLEAIEPFLYNLFCDPDIIDFPFARIGRKPLVQNLYRDSLNLDAVIEKVDEALARFPQPDRAELVFSAHSVPLSVIEKGDPYQSQIEETVELLMQRGGWHNRHRLCYQSKV